MHSAQNAARTSQMSRAGRLGGSGALRGDSLPTVQLRQRAIGAASNFPREMLWRRLRHGQKKEARGKLNHSCARFSQVPVFSNRQATTLRHALAVLWRLKKIGGATAQLARFQTSHAPRRTHSRKTSTRLGGRVDASKEARCERLVRPPGFGGRPRARLGVAISAIFAHEPDFCRIGRNFQPLGTKKLQN